MLLGDPRYVNQGSYGMIPGFQLIDRDFVLVKDHSGHQPQDDLWDLLGTAEDLLE